MPDQRCRPAVSDSWWLFETNNSVAAEVVNALAYKPEGALEKFLIAIDQAEIANASNCLTTRHAESVSLRVLQRRAERLGASAEKTREFLERFLAGALGR